MSYFVISYRLDRNKIRNIQHTLDNGSSSKFDKSLWFLTLECKLYLKIGLEIFPLVKMSHIL